MNSDKLRRRSSPRRRPLEKFREPPRRPLTLDNFRKLANKWKLGSHEEAFATIHVYENDFRRGYDFVPNGFVQLGNGPNAFISTRWLRSQSVQKKGELVYILGMMRDIYDQDAYGRLFPASDRELWVPWALQVCDNNILASNCLNTKAYLDAPTTRNASSTPPSHIKNKNISKRTPKKTTPRFFNI